MSNSLLNWHIHVGEPCGEDATLDHIADYAGDILEGYIQHPGSEEIAKNKLASDQILIMSLEGKIKTLMEQKNIMIKMFDELKEEAEISLEKGHANCIVNTVIGNIDYIDEIKSSIE